MRIVVARVCVVAMGKVEMVRYVSLLPARHSTYFELRSLEPVAPFREDAPVPLLASLMPYVCRLPEGHVGLLVIRSSIWLDVLPLGVPETCLLLVPIQ